MHTRNIAEWCRKGGGSWKLRLGIERVHTLSHKYISADLASNICYQLLIVFSLYMGLQQYNVKVRGFSSCLNLSSYIYVYTYVRHTCVTIITYIVYSWLDLYFLYGLYKHTWGT